MTVRTQRFKAVRKRISAELRRLQSHPAERRIVLTAGGFAAFSLWLGVAWGEPLALVAPPLLAGTAATCLTVLRRRDRRDDPEAIVPPIDSALLIARTRPPSPAAIAAVHEPRAVTLPEPAAAPDVDPLDEQSAPGERRYEVHETAPGGTVLHTVCPTLLAASDHALAIVERRPASTVEVIRVSRGERKVVLSFSDDRVATEPELKQTLLEMYGYPVTSWRAVPAAERPFAQGTSWRASR